jgi:hypothetical protein
MLMRLGRVNEANEIFDRLVESPDSHVEQEVYLDIASTSVVTRNELDS